MKKKKNKNIQLPYMVNFYMNNFSHVNNIFKQKIKMSFIDMVNKIRNSYISLEEYKWPKSVFMPFHYLDSMRDSRLAYLLDCRTDKAVEGLNATIDLCLYMISWMPRKDIITFDDDMIDELIKSDIGNTPSSVFLKMPAWGLYIDVDSQDVRICNKKLNGFWVTFNYLPEYYDSFREVKDKSLISMNFLLFYDANKETGIYYYDQLEFGLREGLSVRDMVTGQIFQRYSYMENPNELYRDVEKIFNIMIYICTYGIVPKNEKNIGIKKNNNCSNQYSETGGFCIAQKPNFFCLGREFGEKIRKWKEKKLAENPEAQNIHSHNSESHNSGIQMQPHIRRGHWHTYLTGPGRTVPIVKWIDPVSVAMREDEDARQMNCMRM